MQKIQAIKAVRDLVNAVREEAKAIEIDFIATNETKFPNVGGLKDCKNLVEAITPLLQNDQPLTKEKCDLREKIEARIEFHKNEVEYFQKGLLENRAALLTLQNLLIQS